MLLNHSSAAGHTFLRRLRFQENPPSPRKTLFQTAIFHRRATLPFMAAISKLKLLRMGLIVPTDHSFRDWRASKSVLKRHPFVEFRYPSGCTFWFWAATHALSRLIHKPNEASKPPTLCHPPKHTARQQTAAMAQPTKDHALPSPVICVFKHTQLRVLYHTQCPTRTKYGVRTLDILKRLRIHHTNDDVSRTTIVRVCRSKNSRVVLSAVEATSAWAAVIQ